MRYTPNHLVTIGSGKSHTQNSICWSYTHAHNFKHSWIIIATAWDRFLELHQTTCESKHVFDFPLEKLIPNSVLKAKKDCTPKKCTPFQEDIGRNLGILAWTQETLRPSFLRGRRGILLVLLLMEEIPNNHPGYIKLCKEWDKLPTSTGACRISEPSTVGLVLAVVG